MPNGGLCPTSTFCEAKRDKHVCSCGSTRFLDLNNLTQCGMLLSLYITVEQNRWSELIVSVYRIGDDASAPGAQCPTENAYRNSTNGICQCVRGYRPTSDRHRCGNVLLLSSIFAILSNFTFRTDTIGWCGPNKLWYESVQRWCLHQNIWKHSFPLRTWRLSVFIPWKFSRCPEKRVL